MGLDLYCLPDNAFHASSFRGQEPGVPKLYTVTQISAMLDYG